MGFLKRIYKWIDVSRLIDSYSGKMEKYGKTNEGIGGGDLALQRGWRSIKSESVCSGPTSSGRRPSTNDRRKPGLQETHPRDPRLRAVGVRGFDYGRKRDGQGDLCQIASL